VVKDTYGCIVYQEQLMNIVRVFGGRTLGGADKFRKAIGKKDIELVKKESHKLYQEIIDHGYSEELALKISDYLSSKGGYMFNLSHSMLYSVLTLQTAYLKAHYPVYFYKALLNQNKNDYGTLNKYIIDAQSMGVEILPPSITYSQKDFSVSNNKIIFGLQAIKGIGEKLVEQIIEERNKENFKGPQDFIIRINPTISQVVSLAKSGAFQKGNKYDFLEKYCNYLFEIKSYSPVGTLPSSKILKEKYDIEFDKKFAKEEKLKIYNEFKEKEFNKAQSLKYQKHKDDFKEKYLKDQDIWEFETLSIFLSDNPFVDGQRLITPLEDIPEGGKCVLIGIISNIEKKVDKNGKQFAFVNLYSTFGLSDITFWHQQYKENEEMLKKGNKIALLCKKMDDNRIIAEQLKPYDVWINERLNKK
jgi:DNA polymerase III subunit alpha